MTFSWIWLFLGHGYYLLRCYVDVDSYVIDGVTEVSNKVKVYLKNNFYIEVFTKLKKYGQIWYKWNI